MTDYPPPSIITKVDVSNPGQFFACCGLLELADRLWPGAEGWFVEDTGAFYVACDGTLDEFIDTFKTVEIHSSLTQDERARLATLLSVPKAGLTPQDAQEKERLRKMWQIERLHVSGPFDLWLDWWRDDRGNRTELKTWAAKQMVAEMVLAMMAAIRGIPSHSLDEILFQPVQHDSLPFNFDSDLCGTGNARDAGFSADTLGLKATYRPLLELLAFIGLQRFRPNKTRAGEQFSYWVWTVPLPVMVAGAAASGNLRLPNSTEYRFQLFQRTQYMKAFLPAQRHVRRPSHV